MSRVRAWGLAALAAAASACAPGAVVVVSPAYEPARVSRVTLVGFNDFPGAVGSGDIAANTFEKYLLLAGYRVVARASNLGTLQSDFDTPGAVTREQLSAAGLSLGVDALAFGTLNDYTGATEQTVMVDVPQEQSDPVYTSVTTTQRAGDTRVRTTSQVVSGYAVTTTDAVVPEEQTTPASVALTVQLLEASTGEVLWSVSASATGDNLPAATEAASAKAMAALIDRLKKAGGKRS
jgi:hypothetical protein